MKLFFLLMLSFLAVFHSCESPKNDDVVGTWQSNDSAEFQFYEDGHFNVKYIPKSILFGNYKDKSLFSGTGVWNIQYMENTWKIELLFPRSNVLPGGFACYLDIEKKLNWRNTSWSLFFYGENFDYKYIFIRSK